MSAVVAGGAKTIYDTAPAGSIFATHVGLLPAFKVGDTMTLDGDQLGRVAATEYIHEERLTIVAIVPELLYWHLKLRFHLKLEGWGELDAPLTTLRIPAHDESLALATCPGCGVTARAEDGWAQKAHMEAEHPEIVERRLVDAGFCNCSPGLPVVGEIGEYATAGCPVHGKKKGKDR